MPGASPDPQKSLEPAPSRAPERHQLATITLTPAVLAEMTTRISAERGVQTTPEQNPEFIEASAARGVADLFVPAFGAWIQSKFASEKSVLSEGLANNLKLTIIELVQNIVAYDILRLTTHEKRLAITQDENYQEIVRNRWRTLDPETSINLSLSIMGDRLILSISGGGIHPVPALKEYWAAPKDTVDESRNTEGIGGTGLSIVVPIFPELYQEEGRRTYITTLPGLLLEDLKAYERSCAA